MLNPDAQTLVNNYLARWHSLDWSGRWEDAMNAIKSDAKVDGRYYDAELRAWCQHFEAGIRSYLHEHPARRTAATGLLLHFRQLYTKYDKKIFGQPLSSDAERRRAQEEERSEALASIIEASITWQDFLQAFKELAAVPHGETLPSLTPLSLRQQHHYGQREAGGTQVRSRRRSQWQYL